MNNPGLVSHDSTSSDKPSVSIERFHDWRVRSAHLISQINNPHDGGAAIESIAATMVEALAPIMPLTLSHNEVQEVKLDALKIVRKAAELDKIFRLSKADFHVFITRVKLPLVQPPSFGFAFDPETMERVITIPVLGPENPVPIVDLAVVPGIFKAGNADGANYGSERVLVKLQALCNLRSVLGMFGAEAPTQAASVEQEMQVKMEVKLEPGFIKLEDPDDEVMLVGAKLEPRDREIIG